MDTRLSHSRPRFELGRGIVAECGVTPSPIVEHFDVLKDILCRLVPCAVLAMINELSLQSAEETLDAGIVPTVPLSRHAAGYAVRGEQLADITYIPMTRGFVYLFAVLDWASRRVLAWRLSNTLTTDFCMEAVQEALASYGAPDIFNTDQGCQFTSQEFTGLLKDHGIQISMDGTGCWRDNVFVERLWRSIKYEEVYVRAYDSISAARQGLGRYLTFYNQQRPHRALDGKTPEQVYCDNLTTRLTAA